MDEDILANEIDNYREACYSFHIDVDSINHKSMLDIGYSHCHTDGHVYISEESNLNLGSKSEGKADSGSCKAKWTDNDNLEWKLISSLSSTVSTQETTNVRELFVLLVNQIRAVV